MTGVWEFLVPPSKFGRADRTVKRARGHELEMINGLSYLCATSGLWNANLGYGNEAIAVAMRHAQEEVPYAGLFRGAHSYAQAAAGDLLEVIPGKYRRVLFSTSGGAANDAALKLSRQYHALRGWPAQRVVVGLRGSYHGLTYGAFSITGEELGQRAYGVDQRFVRHVSHADPDELASLLHREGERLAAIVIEPVLGTGTQEVDPEIVRLAFAARRDYGTVVIADEVATGFGRTGRFLASEVWYERPDVVLLSKGLTNGTSAAAVLLIDSRLSDLYDDLDATFVHAETQAGTPASCAAISATLAEFERLDAVNHGANVAAKLDMALQDLLESPWVSHLTGRGLFRSIVLQTASGQPVGAPVMEEVYEAIRRQGVIVYSAPSAIQIVPSLMYSDGELERLLEGVRRGLERTR